MSGIDVGYLLTGRHGPVSVRSIGQGAREIERTVDNVGRAHGAVEGYNGTRDEAHYRRTGRGDDAHYRALRSHDRLQEYQGGGQSQGGGGYQQEQYGYQRQQYGNQQPQRGGTQSRGDNGPVDELVHAVAIATQTHDKRDIDHAMEVASSFPQGPQGIEVRGRANTGLNRTPLNMSFNGADNYQSAEDIVTTISAQVARKLGKPALTENEIEGDGRQSQPLARPAPEYQRGGTAVDREHQLARDGETQRPVAGAPRGDQDAPGGERQPLPRTAPPAAGASAPGVATPDAPHVETPAADAPRTAPAPVAQTASATPTQIAQVYLQKLGFDTGQFGTDGVRAEGAGKAILDANKDAKPEDVATKFDGVVGRQTRPALNKVQDALGLPHSDTPSKELLDALQNPTRFAELQAKLAAPAAAPTVAAPAAAPGATAPETPAPATTVAAPASPAVPAAAPSATTQTIMTATGLSEKELNGLGSAVLNAQELKTEGSFKSAENANAVIQNLHDVVGADGKVTFKSDYRMETNGANVSFAAGTYTMDQVADKVAKATGLGNTELQATQAASMRYDATHSDISLPPIPEPVIMRSGAAPAPAEPAPAAAAPAAKVVKVSAGVPTELFGGGGFGNSEVASAAPAAPANPAQGLLANVGVTSGAHVETNGAPSTAAAQQNLANARAGRSA